jgi:hypothetical protein
MFLASARRSAETDLSMISSGGLGSGVVQAHRMSYESRMDATKCFHSDEEQRECLTYTHMTIASVLTEHEMAVVTFEVSLALHS